jgi:predicted secreted protein
MVSYTIVKKDVEVPVSVTCDVCGKTYSIEDLEAEEFHHVNFVGGFTSVFGDEVEVTCDICQHCLLELIGKYCWRS